MACSVGGQKKLYYHAECGCHHSRPRAISEDEKREQQREQKQSCPGCGANPAHALGIRTHHHIEHGVDGAAARRPTHGPDEALNVRAGLDTIALTQSFAGRVDAQVRGNGVKAAKRHNFGFVIEGCDLVPLNHLTDPRKLARDITVMRTYNAPDELASLLFSPCKQCRYHV